MAPDTMEKEATHLLQMFTQVLLPSHIPLSTPQEPV